MTQSREQEISWLREHIDRLRSELAGEDTSDAAGDLSSHDQHQADSATELADREQAIGMIERYERRLHQLATGQRPQVIPGSAVPSDPEDTSTPLDEPEPVEDLAAIPMAVEPADTVADPQEADDLPDIDTPGALYPDEGGPPHVGRPEPDDAALRRDYRPD